jgi:hypothetical protein
MASEELLFHLPQTTSGNLLFGETAPVVILDAVAAIALPAFEFNARIIARVDAIIAASLPAPTLACVVVASISAQMNIALPKPGMAGAMTYTSRCARPTVGASANDWQKAGACITGAGSGMQKTQPGPSAAENRTAHATPVGASSSSRFMSAASKAQDRSCRHQEAAPIGAAGPFGYQEAIRLRAGGATHYQAGVARWVARGARYQDGMRTIRESRSASHQAALHGPVAIWRARSGKARPLSRPWITWHQDAMRPPPGTHAGGPVIPPPPALCYTPSPHLLFAALAASETHLLFLCENFNPPPGKVPVVVPVRRVYCVINNVTLYRVPDGVAVPVFSLSLSLDVSSWTWGFEASLPATAESLVAPGNAAGPIELLVTINGTDFRVLAENISRERSFGEASIRISGRGRNAVLAAPYAPVMSYSNAESRTARQLMDDVLTINGISLGWTIDWALTDWNVPTGVFTRQGTWIEALNAIAEAAGGYLLPHPSEKRIRVRHRYPVVPWEWSTVTPDFMLPVDAVSRESLRWSEKPPYNRVFVSGQDVGVVGQVTHTGTAGDILAPMVVDPLITEAQAARQRGIAVLSDTGRQIEVSLRLPVLAETGIIEPGAFVEYHDGSMTKLGLVRATRVEAGLPEVWQTLEVQGYA